MKVVTEFVGFIRWVCNGFCWVSMMNTPQEAVAGGKGATASDTMTRHILSRVAANFSKVLQG